MPFDRPPTLTAAKQYFHLRRMGPDGGEGQLRAGRLTWRIRIRPTPLSRVYLVRIDYQAGNTPRVFVEEPDIVALADGRRLPHVYGEDPVRLCLYLPGAFEWAGWMRIDTTIIPWAALWLFYFEEWLLSDEWKGGGQHPDPAQIRKRRLRRLAEREAA